jgi:DNA-binding helix-hairpin-helix protein with protein kinase domain
MELTPGYAVQTKTGMKATVIDPGNGKSCLGEGGQGAVYLVEYGGKRKALKWYTGRKCKNPEKFYKNLENNIKMGSPGAAFLWPEDITVQDGKAFGYIMELRRAEYKEFSRFLLGRESFESVTAMVNAALNISAAFRALHLKGFSYQDLNDGNFFIERKSGDVLICDNDNVSEYGKNSGIAGKARYMAPEIVAKGAKPDIKTDRFSLSVILFLLWTNSHPLEGKAACPVCMDAKHEKQIYGTNPVFLFDPEDNSNRPVGGLHRGAIARWPFLPEYLRAEFIKAFSKEVLHNPNNRIIEQEWLRLFIRMRGEIYKCSCGEILFVRGDESDVCSKCKKNITFPLRIKTYRYTLPVHRRTKLYACHIEKDSDDYSSLRAQAREGESGFELKNVSDTSWQVQENENTRTLAPEDSLILTKGMRIHFGGSAAQIC